MDHAVQRELFRLVYKTVLAAVLFRSGRKDEADDIASVVGLRCLRAFQTGEVKHPRAYVATAAIRELARLRSRQTTAVPSVEDGRDASIAASPETHDKYLPELLNESLRRLSDGHRECFAAYYLRGESVAAIAQRLGIGEDAVRKRLWRARQLVLSVLQ
jgi:RNA polymerase sigma factor (sigma-70 family)